MPRAYSDDLRTKFLKAYAAGRGSLAELALQFGVSYGYAKKIRRQQIKTGEMERPAQSQHGPKGLLTAEVEQYLRAEIAAQPDLTLAELAQRLHMAHRIGISSSRLWYWLRGLNFCHKKNAERPGTRTPCQPLAAIHLEGSDRRARSRLPGVSR